jgi:uncharacterized coiled-coil DUF342 family protein
VTDRGVATEGRLDSLYREHPEGFVAGRNELAKELRAAGDREEAERIKRLRRPSAAAWLVNLTALSSPESLQAFSEASEQLEATQARALEGDEDAVAEWREAIVHERDALAAIVDTASSLARDAGHPVNQRALELVGETLQAAAGDADLRDRVMRGRVEREQTATTLGTPAGLTPKASSTRSAKKRDLTQARRELERLHDELDEVTARQEELSERIARTTELLRQDKGRLAEAKREATALRKRVKAAERRAKE